MSKSASFVKLVGSMPFTGRHAVKWHYAEGTRAARRGNRVGRDWHAQMLGSYAITNCIMGATGAGLSALTVHHGVYTNALLEFTPAAIITALYSIGHTASSAAQIIMRGQLLTRPVNSVPGPPHRNAAPAPPSSPTLYEQVVTNGGTLGTLLPIAQIALDTIWGQ